MIQLIGAFLLLFSTVMVVAAETTGNYLWILVGGMAYIVGMIECFISPIEGIDDEEI
jgi:hypothetical protein